MQFITKKEQILEGSRLKISWKKITHKRILDQKVKDKKNVFQLQNALLFENLNSGGTES